MLDPPVTSSRAERVAIIGLALALHPNAPLDSYPGGVAG
jgi:hypothetical protein